MEVKGTITKVYPNSGPSWAAVVIKGEDGQTYRAAGKICGAAEGMQITANGEMAETKWGQQLKVESSVLNMADTLTGVEIYLSSGFIKGVGPKRAKAIVSRFGKDTLHVIEENPEKLAEISGITEEKARQISEAFTETQEYMKIIDLLGSDATIYQVRSIYAKYGKDSVKKLKDNPYTIIYDLDGFGFKRADIVAAAMGIKGNDPRRVGAAITYVLKTLATDGHCYCRLEFLEAKIQELVPEITTVNLADVIEREVKEKHLVIEDDRLYITDLWKCENETASMTAKLLKTPPAKSIPSVRIDTVIKHMEDKTGFELEARQKEAISFAVNNRLCVITGGPGTGKTTIIQGIIDVWNDKHSTLLIAPTGRAAKRMSEVTNMSASTIHRLLLEYKVRPQQFEKGSYLILADEASMLDIRLAHALLRFAVQTHSTLVLIGDIYQLPPIGPGNFFRDMVQSPCVPTIRLELSFRQVGKIATNAKRINAGEGMNAYAFDETFQFIPAEKSNIQAKVIQEYKKLLSEYKAENICCITPIRKDTKNKTRATSAEALNRVLRSIANPCKGEIHNEDELRAGDRVMQTVNDPKKLVMNGDCGIVISVNEDEISVKMDDGRVVSYAPAEAKQLVLAYATTVHKSQGSEYEAVIMIQSWEHYFCNLLQRTLLYTGVTRAKKKVILIGEKKAINAAVKKTPNVTRNTQLRTKIGKEVSK